MVGSMMEYANTGWSEGWPKYTCRTLHTFIQMAKPKQARTTHKQDQANAQFLGRRALHGTFARLWDANDGQV